MKEKFESLMRDLERYAKEDSRSAVNVNEKVSRALMNF